MNSYKEQTEPKKRVNVFRKHREKVLAQQGAKDAKDNPHKDATQYELKLAELGNDKRRLKLVKSLKRKVELKQELLPKYLPYVEGVLEAATGEQDNVLTTIMVWAIDCGDLTTALLIGEYALKHKLSTPDQYKRDLVDLLAEEVAEQAITNAESNDFDIGSLEHVAELTAEMDMIDQVRAKVHKGLGLTYANRDRIEEAIPQLEAALKLDERAGVKKILDGLKKKANQ
ncbi:terminase endonuclease subunit [Maricurvus nonylphenolicus]|uniref:phage terminase small subunit n=1 Tax=Maricurvus nonylphenolicus TaxID=1008307 RepID=UPI0036F3DB3F